jgi:hypothetical protein
MQKQEVALQFRDRKNDSNAEVSWNETGNWDF